MDQVQKSVVFNLAMHPSLAQVLKIESSPFNAHKATARAQMFIRAILFFDFDEFFHLKHYN